MAKIPFDIKYRPQIESGEYKAILECGIEAEILAWDKPGEYPIICVAKKDDAIPFRTDGNGKAYHHPDGANYSDLFIIIPEPELTEFEKALKDIVNARDPKNPMTDEGARNNATLLLELAKKEALKDLPRWKKWGNGACGNGRGIPLAIVKRGLDDYQIVDALGIQGEKYIMLFDLEKLSGFKEN